MLPLVTDLSGYQLWSTKPLWRFFKTGVSLHFSVLLSPHATLLSSKPSLPSCPESLDFALQAVTWHPPFPLISLPRVFYCILGDVGSQCLVDIFIGCDV